MAAPFDWSQPQSVEDDLPFAEPAVMAVSCPSSSLCVGIDDLGNVLTSSNPTGGAGTWAVAKVRPSDSTNGFKSIACPSASLCIAADGSGNIATSTNPTGGKGAWATGYLTGGMGFGTITCPTTSLCLATGANEDDHNLAYSTNPAAGVSSWNWLDVGDGADLRGLACASPSLCIVTEEFGNVYTATNPTAGSGAWTKTSLSGNPFLGSAACPSQTLCVIGSGSGVFTSTDPTGGVSAWNAAAVGQVHRLACPSVSLCVGMQSGHTISSTNPTGGAGAWNPSGDSLSEKSPRSLSCPTTTLCLATLGPKIAYSTDPTSTASGVWTEELVDQDGTTGLLTMDCPSSTFCVAGDEMGRILTSTNPMGGPAAWDVFALVTPPPFPVAIKGVSCPSATFCAAVAGGSIYTSTTPTSAASWGKAQLGLFFTGINCPSATLCVALDASGEVFTSINPTGGVAAWQSAMVDSGAEGWSTVGGPTVACPSASLCLAISAHSGNVAVSTNPTGGAAAWSLTSLGEGPLAVACPTVHFCVTTASYPQYKMWTTTNPTGGAAAWSSSSLTSIGAASLSCPTTSFCGAAGYITAEEGYSVAVTANPAGGGSTWQGSTTNPDFHGDRRGLAIDCPSAELCLMGDSQGNLFIGTPGEEEDPPPSDGGSTPTQPTAPAATAALLPTSHSHPMKPLKCRKGFKKKKVKGKLKCVKTKARKGGKHHR